MTNRPSPLSKFVAHGRYLIGSERARIRVAPRTLRRATRQASTPAEIVEAALTAPTGEYGIRPIQVRSEITEFVALVRAEQPQRILEIGTFFGGTLFLFAWASADDARILSLDARSLSAHRRRFYRSFARKHQTLEVRRADSTLEETRAGVERFFGGEPLDLLFIDGDHAYESVRRDYELYSPLVRSGGIVAFHDIVDSPEGDAVGVPRFWREVRGSLCEPVELVESWSQGGCGIGLSRWQPAPERRSLSGSV